jgi:hypothetical protein
MALLKYFVNFFKYDISYTVFLKNSFGLHDKHEEDRLLHIPRKKNLGGFSLHPMRSGSRTSINDRKGMTRRGLQSRPFKFSG